MAKRGKRKKIKVDRRPKQVEKTPRGYSQLIAQAAVHYQRGQVREAEQIYLMILQQHPNEAEVLHILGWFAYSQGQYERAIQLYQQSLAYNSKANPELHNNSGRQRTCSLRDFIPLLELPDITFFSLQKGSQVLELSQSTYKIVNLDRFINDFADTAAVIQALDLVITVDTAVGHLAGALGKPVWTLLPFVPDWRWMLHRPDSPWYPTMQLFRQQQPGNWSEVFLAVQRALQSFIPNREWVTPFSSFAT